ncbi:hypothetical protein ABLG96_01975 [Nakamurella sp. A5-74]|uniref:DUF11 domain-containing protein n=1 Tax=Nakamurella sp. A5-74 TaxID=3158264 RepID=A0AAU8DSI2_9ACTN
MPNHASPTSRRKGLFVLLTGIAASAILALSFSPTMSAFVASITNSTDTAASGYLTMQESNSDGSVLCNSTDSTTVSTNAATCATINKYGGSTAMFPGQTITTNITIKNTGTVNATAFTLTPGACTQANNGTVNGTAVDLCSKINIVIKSGTTTVFSGTLTSLNTGGAINLTALAGIGAVAPTIAVPFSFAVTLDSSAGNTYQGLRASQPLVWSFSA